LEKKKSGFRNENARAIRQEKVSGGGKKDASKGDWLPTAFSITKKRVIEQLKGRGRE